MIIFPTNWSFSQFHKPSGVFVTCLYLLTIFNDLRVWWFQDELSMKFWKLFWYSPVSLLGSVILLVMGIYFMQLEFKTKLKGFILLAIGVWLYAAVLFDTWFIGDGLAFRDIVLRFISLSFILGSLIFQLLYLKRKKNVEG